MRTRAALLVSCLLLVAATACSKDGSHPHSAPSPSSSVAPLVLWPAPPDPLARTAAAGLKAEPRELLQYHVHAHLDVFLDGRPVTVPAGIGINIKDPGVHTFSNPLGYGGINRCKHPCISPLHTHGEDGVLHTESARATPTTLGEFFTEWGVRLSRTCVDDRCAPTTTVAFYVDGAPYTGDPQTMQLTDHKEIAIVIGTPPATVPTTYDFSRA